MKNIDEELQDESIELNDCSTGVIPKIQFTTNDLSSSQMRVSLVPLSGSVGPPSSAFNGKSLANQSSPFPTTSKLRNSTKQQQSSTGREISSLKDSLSCSTTAGSSMAAGSG